MLPAVNKPAGQHIISSSKDCLFKAPTPYAHSHTSSLKAMINQRFYNAYVKITHISVVHSRCINNILKHCCIWQKRHQDIELIFWSQSWKTSFSSIRNLSGEISGFIDRSHRYLSSNFRILLYLLFESNKMSWLLNSIRYFYN